MLSDDKFLSIVRAKLAITKTLHRVAAYKCGVSQSAFSQYINGILPLPNRVREKLILMLELEPIINRLARVENDQQTQRAGDSYLKDRR